MMKLLITVAAVLLVASSALSQQKKSPPVENNLYYRALFASLEKMNKEWGKIDPEIRTDYRHMIVERNLHITDGLPTQSGDYRVEFLDPQQLADRYQRLRKEFPILVAFPMMNDGERVKVSFNVYWFSYEKRRLTYSLSDWSHVYFRYDCEKREFVLDQVELGGI